MTMPRLQSESGAYAYPGGEQRVPRQLVSFSGRLFLLSDTNTYIARLSDVIEGEEAPYQNHVGERPVRSPDRTQHNPV